VFVAGETLSYTKLADIVKGVAGKTAKSELWRIDSLRKELEQDAQNAMRKYRVVFAEGKGVAWDRKLTFNGQNGYQTIGVEQWARQNFKRD